MREKFEKYQKELLLQLALSWLAFCRRRHQAIATNLREFGVTCRSPFSNYLQPRVAEKQSVKKKKVPLTLSFMFQLARRCRSGRCEVNFTTSGSSQMCVCVLHATVLRIKYLDIQADFTLPATA